MSVVVHVDLAVHPLDAVLRACHTFSGRCSVFVRHVEGGVDVELAPREPFDNLEGAFANALLDANLRARIAAETQTIRELIVAQAFCEADLLDRSDSESDEERDPRDILRTRGAAR